MSLFNGLVTACDKRIEVNAESATSILTLHSSLSVPLVPIFDACFLAAGKPCPTLTTMSLINQIVKEQL